MAAVIGNEDVDVRLIEPGQLVGPSIQHRLSRQQCQMPIRRPQATAIVVRPTVLEAYAPPIFTGDNKLEAEKWLKHFDSLFLFSRFLT